MSDYTKAYNGASKDATEATIQGSDFDTEFDAIETAVGTKADKIASPTTGNLISQDAQGNLVDSGHDKDSPDFADLPIPEAADHTSTPAAGTGIIWVKSDTPCTLNFTDDAGTDWVINQALGQWKLVSNGSFSLAANLDITWDETAYDEVKLVFTGLQPATDATSLHVFLGDTNGGTIYTTALDYDGLNRVMDSSVAWSAQSATDKIVALTSASNAANEVIDGEVIVKAVKGSFTGAICDTDMMYVNSSSNIRRFETKNFLDRASAVDTIRLAFSSGNIAANGTYVLYGLKNS